MIRHAILVANTAHSEEPTLSVDAARLNEQVQLVSDGLSHLGHRSFAVTEVKNKDRNQADAELRKAIEAYSTQLDQEEGADPDSCLLFYYFGHGVERAGDLHFIFKNSNTDKLATMLAFRYVTDTVFGFGVPRTLFILDCCHAGSAAVSLQQAPRPQLYYIMASTAAASRALITRERVPFGAFSTYLFQGLRHRNAARGRSRKITIESWFRYAQALVKGQYPGQEPRHLDGGLSDLVVGELEIEPVIEPQFNARAPRKTFYRKMWWICKQVEAKPLTGTALYKRVEKQRPVELLTAVKRGEVTVQEPVREETFIGYLEDLARLGMVERDNGSISLSADGRSALARQGARFNSVLKGLLEKELQQSDLTLQNLDDLVRENADARGIPTAAAIYFVARNIYKIDMRPEWFSLLINLLGEIGFFRYASKRTFFPY